VVFSFFKKDPKDAKGTGRSSGAGSARDSARAAAKPPAGAARGGSVAANTTRSFATTENAMPERTLARTLAMETAAKIDKIESEMARDFLRPAANTGGNAQAAAATTQGPRSAIAPAPPKAAASAAPAGTPIAAAAADTDPDEDLGDVYLGTLQAIELHTSGAGSVIDETAILFANGQAPEAEATLRAGIDADDLGAALQNAWLMLFELVNQRGDRAGFEQLTMQYALRFENSPPAWIDYSPAATPSRTVQPQVMSGAPVVRLPATIDAQIVKPLEQLKLLAAQHAALTLDASATRSVDLVGAELLLRVINAFKRSSHELTVAGVESLLNPLRAAVEPGRRDSSDAAWMLLLEVLRLLMRQDDFEETGIQYCITFEVSPPSWEPPPVNLKTSAAVAATAASASAAALVEASSSPLDWRGAIDAEGEPYVGRLALEARTQTQLSVEFRLLRAMAFSAASALLSQLMRLHAAGVVVEFRNVNPLVAALFHLLGVTSVAQVHVRRN
jgi:anti-anti-sigma regulatory factor